ncbi:hypothetical protein AGLY_009573 [Aphis glycines]|uniref:Uncharacterized protein n=1 Tax=Aphis glycines TaxID=307491 RepID=A0A6G0TI83_APHGL|nr:hypothetical protein AGLY_009573 [Aphis glycines]
MVQICDRLLNKELSLKKIVNFNHIVEMNKYILQLSELKPVTPKKSLKNTTPGTDQYNLNDFFLRGDSTTVVLNIRKHPARDTSNLNKIFRSNTCAQHNKINKSLNLKFDILIDILKNKENRNVSVFFLLLSYKFKYTKRKIINKNDLLLLTTNLLLFSNLATSAISLSPSCNNLIRSSSSNSIISNTVIITRPNNSTLSVHLLIISDQQLEITNHLNSIHQHMLELNVLPVKKPV